MQVNKSSKNYYLSDVNVIVADDKVISQIIWLEVQHKENFAVTMVGSGLKSATEEKVTCIVECKQTNCHESTRG
jgi:hypothetical protein